LKKSQDEMLEDAVKVVEYAKDHGLVVELAAEDSTRTDIEYLRRIFKATIDAGADRICPCDTLGMLTPLKSFNFHRKLSDLGVPLSAHCHNDFGLAVANTLSAIDGGASRFHGTINGLGERAGNAAIEEVVVSLNTLYKYSEEDEESKYTTDIKINQLYSTSKLVSRLSNAYLAPNKPIVGENAFAHESGIHTDGVIKNSATYEPIMPELVGHRRKFIIGKHVGTKGLDERLKELGLEVNKDQLNEIFIKVKDLGDKGKTVTDTDLEAIAEHVLNIEQEKKINLDELTINGSRYLLCEMPLTPFDTHNVIRWFDELIDRSYIPVLAHPERYVELHRDYNLVDEILARPILLQVNIDSLRGRNGEAPHGMAMDLINRGFAHFMASDAHDLVYRHTRLTEKFEDFSDDITDEIIETFMRDNPLKVLNNKDII
jgi:isopropylmalate/homocitrate/citramalate synthase